MYTAADALPAAGGPWALLCCPLGAPQNTAATQAASSSSVRPLSKIEQPPCISPGQPPHASAADSVNLSAMMRPASHKDSHQRSGANLVGADCPPLDEYRLDGRLVLVGGCGRLRHVAGSWPAVDGDRPPV